MGYPVGFSLVGVLINLLALLLWANPNRISGVGNDFIYYSALFFTIVSLLSSITFIYIFRTLVDEKLKDPKTQSNVVNVASMTKLDNFPEKQKERLLDFIVGKDASKEDRDFQWQLLMTNPQYIFFPMANILIESEKASSRLNQTILYLTYLLVFLAALQVFSAIIPNFYYAAFWSAITMIVWAVSIDQIVRRTSNKDN
jgi:hypothetical protein